MTSGTLHSAPVATGDDLTPAQHHPDRWVLNRAGILNVWYYHDSTFEISGGRLILRGTNGSGKSRALELLFPFLFDADRRRMDATGSAKVQLTDLMKAGAGEGTNRVGYLWAELRRPAVPDPASAPDSPGTTANKGGFEHLTIGAYLRYSRSTGEVKVHYFTTPLRVGPELPLMSPAREPLPREELMERIGADRVTAPAEHRTRIAQTVFGLGGERAAERYNGLLQLLHTLRSPDVGNRIEEGRLPQILTDALPPLSEQALDAAGEKLDGLTETRASQERLRASLGHVQTFLDVYRNYAAARVAEAATAAKEAADENHRAVREADDLRRKHKELQSAKTQIDAGLGELESTERELESTIKGIEESKAIEDLKDLHERTRRVAAQKGTAESTLGSAQSARENEAATVKRADKQASDVRDAAAGFNKALAAARQAIADTGVPDGAVTGLPDDVIVTLMSSPSDTAAIRTSVDGDPRPQPRPTPKALIVVPDDPDGLANKIDRVRDVVELRIGQARQRADVAHKLERDHQEVTNAAERAEEKAAEAEAEAVVAEDRTEELGRSVDQYVANWGDWLALPAIADILRSQQANDPEHSDAAGSQESAGRGPSTAAEPSTAALEVLQRALVDPDVLMEAPVDLLARLDRAPHDITAPAHQRLAEETSVLKLADDADRVQDRKLAEEQRALEAAKDPEPDSAQWQTSHPEDSVPLWRATDFAPELDEESRAGVEGAMAASGLLTASISPDGQVRATDGQVLATTQASVVASRSAVELLQPDTTSGLPAHLVRAILERIEVREPGTESRAGTAPGGAALWIAADGSWGSGPLTGRHQPAAAQYIGVAARAANRSARLAEIAAERHDIAEAVTSRAAVRREIGAQIAEVRAAAGDAPRSQPILTAHRIAQDAAQRARDASAAAGKAKNHAEHVRREWSAAQQSHRQICEERGLPIGARELDEVHRNSRAAVIACDHARDAHARLKHRLGDHTSALDDVAGAVARRRTAESDADAKWLIWNQEAATLATIEENVGVEAKAAEQLLEETRGEQARIHGEVVAARIKRDELIGEVSRASGEADRAEDAVPDAVENLGAASARLQRICGLTGIAAAAFATDPGDLTTDATEPRDVKVLASRILVVVHNHSTRSDETTLGRAQQVLERELSGVYDVDVRVEDGVRLIALSDTTGTRPVAEAAAGLSEQVVAGDAALTERERKVFEEFVLGSVARELQDRLARARELVDAMNASLGTIRTSHGIGVRLRWTLADDSDPAIKQLRDLVTLRSEIRRRDQDVELTDLLKDRVARSFALDPSAGYTAHLQTALDYRQWYQMDVIILGPLPNQERRISRRAKLSQGETRFVSYVTLFAAIDAYLSGLPDTGKALRLLLLDDAFAKVDDPTIAELMGLLVRLDIDFVMTGHALWGTYPQVPKLDAYEVRRAQGTSAITTHVHWDGRNRHLRPMGG